MSASRMVPAIVGVLVAAGLLTTVTLGVRSALASAERRLKDPNAAKPKVAVADHAEEKYCTPRFKQVLERVLHSCGLLEANSRRGCKPADVKSFASINDDDFNELFLPLKHRGAVLKFETGKHELDESAKKLLAERWDARRGARYFFVVGRASSVGDTAKNRALSHRRANSVQFFIKENRKEPDLEKKIGLLWLGEEFAQLPKEFCEWPNSSPSEKCNQDSINRSAFVSWVDCRL